MEDTELSAYVCASFSLGARISQMADNVPDGKSKNEHVVDLLMAVALGKETILPTGAELRQLFPEAKGIEEYVSANQKMDQKIARMIVAYFTSLE